MQQQQQQQQQEEVKQQSFIMRDTLIDENIQQTESVFQKIDNCGQLLRLFNPTDANIKMFQFNCLQLNYSQERYPHEGTILRSDWDCFKETDQLPYILIITDGEFDEEHREEFGRTDFKHLKQFRNDLYFLGIEQFNPEQLNTLYDGNQEMIDQHVFKVQKSSFNDMFKMFQYFPFLSSQTNKANVDLFTQMIIQQQQTQGVLDVFKFLDDIGANDCYQKMHYRMNYENHGIVIIQKKKIIISKFYQLFGTDQRVYVYLDISGSTQSPIENDGDKSFKMNLKDTLITIFNQYHMEEDMKIVDLVGTLSEIAYRKHFKQMPLTFQEYSFFLDQDLKLDERDIFFSQIIKDIGQSKWDKLKRVWQKTKDIKNGVQKIQKIEQELDLCQLQPSLRKQCSYEPLMLEKKMSRVINQFSCNQDNIYRDESQVDQLIDSIKQQKREQTQDGYDFQYCLITYQNFNFYCICKNRHLLGVSSDTDNQHMKENMTNIAKFIADYIQQGTLRCWYCKELHDELMTIDNLSTIMQAECEGCGQNITLRNRCIQDVKKNTQSFDMFKVVLRQFTDFPIKQVEVNYQSKICTKCIQEK